MKMKNKSYTFNMNDEATVILTEFGKKIYKEYYKKFPEHIRPEYDKKLTTELWQIMEIFGKYFYVGCNVLFENNSIKIKKQ